MTVQTGKKRTEIRLAGEGGQGMILAGIILAEAAAIYDGKNAVQSQSYGPEARGGASRSEVIISDDEIDFPEVILPNILVALSQMAYDKYATNLSPDGLLIVDDEKVKNVSGDKVIKLPVGRIALEVTGKAITSNTVVLGILVGLTGLVSRPALEQAVAAHAPKGTAEINTKALQAGFEQAEMILKAGVLPG
jgi:2-oxoglutarate ferredoxin oxidoreductase subunit gamma